MKEQLLKTIIEKTEVFESEIKNLIYEVCENSDYQDSSKFSYNIDRLNQFINELKSFKFLNK